MKAQWASFRILYYVLSKGNLDGIVLSYKMKDTSQHWVNEISICLG